MSEKTKQIQIDQLIKKSVFDASAITSKEKNIISFSPILDDLLGGGICSASFVLIAGRYKVGKTTAVLHFAKNAQKQNFKVVYINGEQRLIKRDLVEQRGLDLSPDKFELIQSSDAIHLSAEDIIMLAEHKLRMEKNIVLVIDSLSQLCAKDLLDGDIRDRYRDSTPLLLSKFTKRACVPISVNNNILIGITHEIANQSSPYGGTTEAGGRKIQYAADFKLRAKFSKPWQDNNKKIIGQTIEWECKTSALGIPNKVGNGRLRYGIGLDETAELFDLATINQVIKKSGAWFELKDQKYHGEYSIIEALENDTELCDYVKEELAIRLGNASN